MKAVLVLLCIVLFIYGVGGQYNANGLVISNPNNAPDMPNFTPDPQTIPANSLIIPNDPSNQVLDPGTGLLSVLPYGLVIRTLHDNVTIWWCIQTGKSQDAADVVATTQSISFSAISGFAGTPTYSNLPWNAPALTTYSGGPFIILSKDTNNVLARWQLWSQSGTAYYQTVDPSVYDTVQVHLLTADTVMDIRHRIYVRPSVGISNLDGNAPTQTAMMGCVYQDNPRLCPEEGGYGSGGLFGNGAPGCKAFTPQDHAGLDYNVHYVAYDCGSSVAALTSTTCLTTFCEPHWEWYQATGPAYISAMKSFIFSGANFLAQCASIQSYENQAGTLGTGTFMSIYGMGSTYETYGDVIPPYTPETIAQYPDLPISQYVGWMTSNRWGAVSDFYNYFGTTNDVPPTGWDTTPPGNGPVYPTGELKWYPAGSVTQVAWPVVTDNINSANLGTQWGFDGRNLYVTAAAKYNPSFQLGANVFYLAGHSWAGLAITGSENGRRVFFNAIVIPAARPPACGFTFCNPSDTCPPQDACHTCACNAAGNGFVQTLIPGCCLNNTGCTATCQICNTVTHVCQNDPTCCNVAQNINCSALCQDCVAGVCTPAPGCCTSTPQCGSSNPCVICQNSACVTQPTSTCCDPSQAGSCASINACMYCDATTNQCVRNTSCCLINSDCGNNTNICDVCNTATNLCYSTPGCCNQASDCGTNPCINCVSNACVTNSSCCYKNQQCGKCKVCNNATNSCVSEGSTSCCVVDTDCGSCQRCATAANGTKSCVPIDFCCNSAAQCEACENCTNQVCVPISGCCHFDSDCSGCEYCVNHTCSAHPTLYCCRDDYDCTIVALQYHNASCGYVCTSSGFCQQSCSSGANWLGLIIGLAAGVPLALLCCLGLLCALAALLYWKKDYLTEKFWNKTPFADTGASNNPAYTPGVNVMSSGL